MSENPTITTERSRQSKIGGDTGDAAMYAKVSPEIRRDLDEAIVNHKPATYRGIYEKFRLVERGVSFWSFYRYAVNVRSQAEKHHFGELVLPAEAHLRDTLPKLIAQRLLETLLYDEELSPKEVLRLTTAYRAASLTAIARAKAAATREKEQRAPAPNRARAGARDIAPIRARAEASGNTDGSDASPASGEADDNLHLLENYIAALERANKAREQAAQADPLVRESLLAPTSEGIPSHVASAPADPPPADLVPHSTRVPPFAIRSSPFAIPSSSPSTQPLEPSTPPPAPGAVAYLEELLRQPDMRQLGLPSTPAEFAEAIRHLAPGIADAISPARASREGEAPAEPPSPARISYKEEDAPFIDAPPLLPGYPPPSIRFAGRSAPRTQHSALSTQHSCPTPAPASPDPPTRAPISLSQRRKDRRRQRRRERHRGRRT